MTTGPAVPMRLARVEGQHLVALIDQFLELLQETAIGDLRQAQGPSPLDRLTPAVYPEDPAASAQFAEATSAELLDRRAADARVVRASLQPSVDGGVPDQFELLVPAGELDAWLRTLTSLRLVIASRLGIEDGDAHDPEDPRFGVYDWLGYRLDLLIETADALDDEQPGS
ncbi:DUF2017 family protein [Microbacterium sp. 22242]|uniref:DUF2017 family protein n=1 Tax=Microbacterium sp. 22242 TaxID=3453896 RepID=UPI003F829773